MRDWTFMACLGHVMVDRRKIIVWLAYDEGDRTPWTINVAQEFDSGTVASLTTAATSSDGRSWKAKTNHIQSFIDTITDEHRAEARELYWSDVMADALMAVQHHEALLEEARWQLVLAQARSGRLGPDVSQAVLQMRDTWDGTAFELRDAAQRLVGGDGT